MKLLHKFWPPGPYAEGDAADRCQLQLISLAGVLRVCNEPASAHAAEPESVTAEEGR